MSSTAQRNVTDVAEGKENRLTLLVADRKVQTVSHDAQRQAGLGIGNAVRLTCNQCTDADVTNADVASRTRVLHWIHVQSTPLDVVFEDKIVILAILFAENANLKNYDQLTEREGGEGLIQ